MEKLKEGEKKKANLVNSFFPVICFRCGNEYRLGGLLIIAGSIFNKKNSWSTLCKLCNDLLEKEKKEEEKKFHYYSLYLSAKFKKINFILISIAIFLILLTGFFSKKLFSFDTVSWFFVSLIICPIIWFLLVNLTWVFESFLKIFKMRKKKEDDSVSDKIEGEEKK